MHIIEEVSAVPAAKDHHFGAADEVGGVIETSDGGATTFRSLIPSHRDGVKRVQIAVDGAFRAFTTEDDDAGACEHCCVGVASRWWRATNLRFEPTRAIDIEHVSIIQVCEASLFTLIEMTSKNDKRSTSKRG